MKTKKRLLAMELVGVESSRRSLFRALANRDNLDVTLVVPKHWREQGDVQRWEMEPAGMLHVDPMSILLGHRAHRVLMHELFKIVYTLKPDFIFFDTEPENYLAVEILLAARLFSRSSKLALVSSRTIDHWKFGYPYRFALTHRICDAIVRWHGVDLLFVRPKSAMQNVSAYSPAIVHLPHSVDCTVFRKRTSPNHPERKPNVTIGYLGRLAEGKGIHLLIQSMPSLPTEVRLLIVGSGPLSQELVGLAKALDVADRIDFRPAVRYEDVPAVLNQFDLLVLPSVQTRYWNEQFGRVLIEAMACEVPVLASDSAGIPDVVGDAGILFRTGDVSDLTAKLRILVGDPGQRLRYQGLGRRRALSEFDVPVIADRLAEAFDACLRAS